MYEHTHTNTHTDRGKGRTPTLRECLQLECLLNQLQIKLYETKNLMILKSDTLISCVIPNIPDFVRASIIDVV